MPRRLAIQGFRPRARLWTGGSACRPRPVRPALTVLQARYENGRRVRLRFNTGEHGVADLTDLGARYPAARPLADPAELASFEQEEWPTLVWACGLDVSPETLYERATGKRLDGLMPAPVLPAPPRRTLPHRCLTRPCP